MGLKKLKKKVARHAPKKRKSTIKRKLTLKTRRATRRHSAKSSFIWPASLAAGVFLVAFGLWQSFKPMDTPSPTVGVTAVDVPKPEPKKFETKKDGLSKREVAGKEVDVVGSQFNRNQKLDLSARIDSWSKFLWRGEEAKDFLARLGKGPKIEDTAPLIPKKFDCTTYVETVAALVRSNSKDDFFRNLIAIRYRDSKTTYLNRNHFPEIDWIPNNEKAGILKDITTSVAQTSGVQAKVETKMIDKDKWLSVQVNNGKVDRSLASMQKWGAPVEAKVTYISIDDVQRVLNKIPSGSIINLVRKNNDKQPVLITHQGYVVQEGGVTLLRHASPSGKVRTTLLKGYLETTRENDMAKHWPIVGINLNQLQD